MPDPPFGKMTVAPEADSALLYEGITKGGVASSASNVHSLIIISAGTEAMLIDREMWRGWRPANGDRGAPEAVPISGLLVFCLRLSTGMR
jgi:hypothetical protein